MMATRLMATSGIHQTARPYLSAAYTRGSWRRHAAALSCFSLFEAESGQAPWPLDISTIVNFCAWGFKSRNLRASTMNSYLSSLKCMHELKGLNSDGFKSYPVKTVIRGKENLEIYSAPKHTRKVMTLHLLRLLGHEIDGQAWNPNSKLVVWGAATLGFFGSFRMGELLPGHHSRFCPEDTLLWNDLKFIDSEHMLVHVKSPKSRAREGEFVDIFKVRGVGVCPVATMMALRESLGGEVGQKPVFQFDNGKNLTMESFNACIQDLLAPHIGHCSRNISCHSFRAAIPSALARFPEVANEADIKGWARWEGNDYTRYTRLRVEKRRSMFYKIMSVLEKS